MGDKVVFVYDNKPILFEITSTISYDSKIGDYVVQATPVTNLNPEELCYFMFYRKDLNFFTFKLRELISLNTPIGKLLFNEFFISSRGSSKAKE
jgi:hypothetical protein